jgi:hypothetical protein
VHGTSATVQAAAQWPPQPPPPQAGLHRPCPLQGLDDALRCGALSRQELAWLHPYQPSLSACWLFQRRSAPLPACLWPWGLLARSMLGSLRKPCAPACRSMSVGVGQLHEAQQQLRQKQGLSQLPAGSPVHPLQLPLNHVNEVLVLYAGGRGGRGPVYRAQICRRLLPAGFPQLGRRGCRCLHATSRS